MAVFQGPVIGLQTQANKYNAPQPIKQGQNQVIQSMSGRSAYGTTEITGWNNNPNETLLVTITLPTVPDENAANTLWLQVMKKQNGANMPTAPNILADGASYHFENVTPVNTTEQVGVLEYKFTGENWDWTEYSFSIVDSANTSKVLKPGKIVFKYPGLAAIEAENGSVKCGETTYTNGQTVNLGTGEKTITAVPDAGYVFTGWEIGGVILDDATANPLIFTMPSASTTIKANFAKAIKVTTLVNDESYGTVMTTSKLDGLKNGDKVELTATPKENSHVTFSKWVVYKSDTGTTKAAENTDYKLTKTEGQPGHATLEVLGTANLRVMAVFQGPVVSVKSNRV